MLPRVVLHNAVSVDGRITGFQIDLGLYYGLVGTWKEDATLAGSDTLLTATDAELDSDDAPEPAAKEAGDTRPLLVVPDSRGSIRTWDWMRKQPYWRDVVVLCSRATPSEYLDHLERRGIDSIVVGETHVDLRAALEELCGRYGVKSVRADSGGTLNGTLLRAGLVDEVSVVVCPTLVGGSSPQSVFRAPDLASEGGAIKVRLTHLERLEGDHVWLRYEVVK